jgi:glycosyltransferase involved in cell wall biosynthesis
MPETQRSLRIAWIGAGPGLEETGGVAGVATELLHGLAELGHRIDCFLPRSVRTLPPRLEQAEEITFIWGTSDWRWNRWYSRSPMTAFVSGLISRSVASLRLRREIARRHASEPFDVIYQFSNIETLAMPASLRRSVPLVIHPETHVAGELRSLIAERRLSLRCQPAYMFAALVVIMSIRAALQRVRIRRARLLVCISAVFRDHLVRDYGFPVDSTVVIPNPVSLERFAGLDLQPRRPPTVLVLGRVSLRKGIEDVVAVAGELLERRSDARVRVVGGPSLWSDYTKLLEDLPAENAEYAGALAASEIPTELAHSGVLLQASRYEPFALTVAEALAAGVPVVGTSEVGAIADVDRRVAVEVQPGDVEGMTAAVERLLEEVRAQPQQMRALARAEAERLFAPDVVCRKISLALEQLGEGPGPLHSPPLPEVRQPV